MTATKRTDGQSHIVANAAADTYADISDPLQGTDHARFRDVVAGVQGKSQEDQRDGDGEENMLPSKRELIKSK